MPTSADLCKTAIVVLMTPHEEKYFPSTGEAITTVLQLVTALLWDGMIPMTRKILPLVQGLTYVD